MVSRRNLITIILMMMTIFFMFQFTQVIKVRNNQYDTNLYAKESVLVEKEKFDADAACEWVVYFGKTDTEAYESVKEWCGYSKKYLKTFSDLDDADVLTLKRARLIVIDAKASDCINKGKTLEKMAEYETPMVFFDLPDAEKIATSARLRRLFGIKKTVMPEVEAKGFQVFKGFLLGGEAAYMPQKEEEEKYNDFDCMVPWFKLGSGTKTYAVAMMDEDEVKANDFPNLIWSHNYKGNLIYVVAFDLINRDTGMGFLSAIDYSANEYSLYPVVNAQNMVLSDFPVITEENTDKINELYSMNSMSLCRDITWPVFISISRRYNLKLTCFTNTGFSENAGKQNEEYLNFYLQQLKEIDGEMGRSLNTESDDLSEKIKNDGKFFNGKENGYSYSAAYIPEMTGDSRGILKENAFGLLGVHTIAGKNTENADIISYLNDTITYQGITNVADEYTYSKELKYRCMLTAIGYSNILIDMHKVGFPESKDDEWQNFSRKISSNIHTFWTGNKEFDFTALSESDTRAREFLNLKYDYEKTGDSLVLNTSNVDEAYFVLRTHGEKITSIEGGEYSFMEEGAYLIHATAPRTVIGLGKSDRIFEYDGLLR